MQPQKREREITSGSVTFLKPKDMQIDQEIIGKLSKVVEGQYGLTYYLKQQDGSTIGVNGAGQLDSLMEQIAEGETVRIVYKGQVKLKSGAFKGKPAHQFKVFLVESDDAPTADIEAKTLES